MTTPPLEHIRRSAPKSLRFSVGKSFSPLSFSPQCESASGFSSHSSRPTSPRFPQSPRNSSRSCCFCSASAERSVELLERGLAELDPVATLSFSFPVWAFAFFVEYIAGASPIAAGASLTVPEIVFRTPSVMQNRILNRASDTPDRASILVSLAATIGAAIGPILGVQTLVTDFSYPQLPWIGVVFSALAAGIMVFSPKFEKKSSGQPYRFGIRDTMQDVKAQSFLKAT